MHRPPFVVTRKGHDLPAAREAFLDALALDPRDEKARFNLEWTLLAMAERPPLELPPPPKPSDAPEPPAQLPLPEPDPEPPEEQAEGPESASPPPALSEERQRRLLERIEDDPRHALRSAARAVRVPERRGGTPVW